MYRLVLISAVHLYSITFTSAGNISVTESFNLTKNNENITIHENVHLNLKVRNLNSEMEEGDCTGSCKLKSQTIPDIDCKVVKEPNLYINMITTRNVTRNDSGPWTCEFHVIQKQTRILNQNGKQITPVPIRHHTSNFQLLVKFDVIQPARDYWPYIFSGICVLVLLIIVGQTICIIYFRRKAKAVRRQAEWTSRTESVQDTVRYSKMPGQKIKIQPCMEARESGIYEALETVRAAAVPEPPPLKTLPRTTGSINSELRKPPTNSDIEDTTIRRTASNNFISSLTRSLANSKKPKIETVSENKRSTIERIKTRAPMRIPTEEVYEAMEYSPTPVRKELKKKEDSIKEEKKKEDKLKGDQKKIVKPKEEFQAFKTKSTPRSAQPSNNSKSIGAGPQMLGPQGLPSQLKHALEIRNRTNSAALSLSPTPKAVIPFNPGLPPPLATPPAIVNRTPQLGRHMTSPSEVLKWKPPPPAKPKQLHPLPPPPPAPEPIHVITERDPDGGYDDDDEEWTYEPLPAYNIYSM